MNLARASLYLTGLNTGLSFISALNFFFLAAAFTPRQLGTLSILLTIPVVIMPVLNLGYNKAAIYYLGRKEFSLEAIITNGIIICLMWEVFLCFSLVIFKDYIGQVFSDISFNWFCLAVASTPIQVFLFYLTEACLGAGKIEVTILTRTLSVMIYVLGCGLTAIAGKLTIGLAFIYYLSGLFVADVVGVVQIIIKSQERHRFKPDLNAALCCLKFGGKTQIGELLQYLSIRLDLILVGFWTSMEATGYYSMATRLAETIWLVAHSVQLALAAKVAQSFQDSPESKRARLERMVRYMAVGSLLVSIAMLTLSFIVFKFFLPKYEPSFLPLLLLSPGQIGLAVFVLMMANLISDGYPMVATKVRLVLFTLSLILYVTLIPFSGILGAGLATSIAYIASAVFAALVLAKIYDIKLLNFILWKKEDSEFLKLPKKYISKYLMM